MPSCIRRPYGLSGNVFSRSRASNHDRGPFERRPVGPCSGDRAEDEPRAHDRSVVSIRLADGDPGQGLVGCTGPLARLEAAQARGASPIHTLDSARPWASASASARAAFSSKVSSVAPDLSALTIALAAARHRRRASNRTARSKNSSAVASPAFGPHPDVRVDGLEDQVRVAGGLGAPRNRAICAHTASAPRSSMASSPRRRGARVAAARPVVVADERERPCRDIERVSEARLLEPGHPESARRRREAPAAPRRVPRPPSSLAQAPPRSRRPRARRRRSPGRGFRCPENDCRDGSAAGRGARRSPSGVRSTARPRLSRAAS